MLFNSFEFVAFLILFIVIFFSVPKRAQPFVLLVASYIFYMGWRPAFALLLAFTTVVDYFTARWMGATEDPRSRKLAMITALTINLGILGTVKYLDFAISNIVGAAGFFGYVLPDYALGLILPVGISFYTFQSIGYTIDVYNRKVEPERDFITYAQYVSFFPQLVAGPIERAGHMLPQFRKPHFLRRENIAPAMWLIGYGLFKKMCVADAIAPVVSGIFSAPGDYDGAYNLLGALLFAIQIYCDFSGYSDIARGVARLIDFDLMINFKQPYFATSLTDFWRRWHISLSTWFRDYLYLPLGGNRVTTGRWAVNTMIVFVVSGIWHGAAWTFVIWGALHGAGLLIERGLKALFGDSALHRAARPALPIVGWIWTMAIVLIGWIFFRAGTLENALTSIRSFGHMGTLSYETFKVLNLPSFEIVTLIGSLVLLIIVDWQIAHPGGTMRRLGTQRWIAIPAGVALAYLVLLFGVFGRMDFIYFQF